MESNEQKIQIAIDRKVASIIDDSACCETVVSKWRTSTITKARKSIVKAQESLDSTDSELLEKKFEELRTDCLDAEKELLELQKVNKYW